MVITFLCGKGYIIYLLQEDVHMYDCNKQKQFNKVIMFSLCTVIIAALSLETEDVHSCIISFALDMKRTSNSEEITLMGVSHAVGRVFLV